MFLICQICLANFDIEQGKYISESDLNEINIGISKYSIMQKFGEPTFIFTEINECFCYYYIYYPISKKLDTKKCCVLFSFENGILISSTIRFKCREL